MLFQRTKSGFKSVLRVVAPSLVDTATAFRSRQMFRRRFAKMQEEISACLYPNNDVRVLAGPFSGMAYLDEIVWGSIIPKWLGTYEAELHPIIQRILTTKYGSILDVGAAEGYYAVGLARGVPGIPVYSFDVDPFARKQQARLAEKNGVTNLSIEKFCSHEDVTQLVNGRSLVVCDIEGHELNFLRPDVCSALKVCDLLVEVHEFAGRRCEEVRDILQHRFQESHEIEVITVKPRDVAEWGGLLRDTGLSEAEFLAATEEHRGHQQYWLWMQSIDAAKGG